MIVLLLIAVLALAAGGCVCVVWAARGGPRWVRGVSRATLALSEVASAASKRSNRSSSRSSGDDGVS